MPWSNLEGISLVTKTNNRATHAELALSIFSLFFFFTVIQKKKNGRQRRCHKKEMMHSLLIR